MKKRQLLLISALAVLTLGGCDVQFHFGDFSNAPQVTTHVDDINDGTGQDTGGDSGGGGGTIVDGGGGETLEGYYAGIKTNSSTLVADLHKLNSNKRKKTVGYNSMPSYYTKTDKGTKSDEVIAFYAGTSDKYSGNMNREHVWPNSLGGSSVENDIHMPRPTYSADNGSRGNEYYVEGRHGPAKPYKETGWDPGAFADQDASYRGDSARIIFYCAIANTNLKIVDTDGSSKPANTMGKLSDLLKWNLRYPVLERETLRNDEIEKIQGNRNPFIDHPELACKIWGNTNSTTKAICGGK